MRRACDGERTSVTAPSGSPAACSAGRTALRLDRFRGAERVAADAHDGRVPAAKHTDAVGEDVRASLEDEGDDTERCAASFDASSRRPLARSMTSPRRDGAFAQPSRPSIIASRILARRDESRRRSACCRCALDVRVVGAAIDGPDRFVGEPVGEGSEEARDLLVASTGDICRARACSVLGLRDRASRRLTAMTDRHLGIVTVVDYVGHRAIDPASATTTRNAVCATIRWSGRTDRPSTVHPRCIVSNVRTIVPARAERPDEVLDLRHRRHVRDEDAAGTQAPLDVRQCAPRLGEVEHDAVDLDRRSRPCTCQPMRASSVP